MDRSTITSFLAANTDLDKVLVEQLIGNCKCQHVSKGSFLLRQGETCKYSFFVEEGLLRYFSIDDKGKEHILQFAPEQWFLTDRESVFFNQASRYFIQALENSVVVLLDEKFLSTLAHDHRSFMDFHYRLLHNHIRHLQTRINQLLSATAEERYVDFIKLYPDLLSRVPQAMIASYLGITPESLSRVRKDMAVKSVKR